MRKNTIIKAVSGVLAVVLVGTAAAGCQSEPATDNEILNQAQSGEEYVHQTYTAAAENVKKDETVYVNTKADGTVYKVNVTDWIHTDTPQVRITDISNLSDIKNVKTLTLPIEENGKLYWDMDTTDLYYSGVTEEEPPVKFTIKYFLEGEEMTPEEIAGKKGNVKIQIKVENTLTKVVTIDDKKYDITCPMLVAGGTIMTEDTFSNIAIDHGSAISDGAKQVVFFAGIPGMDDSLGLSDLDISLIDESMYSDTYTITAYTEKFELSNLMFAVMPFSSVGTLGNGGLTETIDDVKDVLTDIEKIETAMNGLDVNKMIDLLYGDSNKIESIMNAVSEATALCNDNEKLLKTLGSYMTDENIAKIDKLITDLNNTDLDSLASTLNDPALQTLLSMLPQLSESIASVTDLAQDMEDVMPIFESLAAEMDDPEIKKSVENLPETLEKLNEILSVMNSNKELLETFGKLASGDSVEQIEAILDTADKYAGSGNMSEEQSESLAGKMEEWLVFGSEYDIFTERTENMESTVVFTYKTDAVSAPSEETATAQAEETEEGGIVAWFKNLFS